MYCAHCILWFDLFAPKTMSPPPYTTILLRTVHCIHCILWFDLFVSKTMSLPPYTTIPLHPLHTASTGLTYLHHRTMSPPPYTTIPLHTAHCIHWFDLFAPKNNVPTTIYHYSAASIVYFIHTIESLLCNSSTT